MRLQDPTSSRSRGRRLVTLTALAAVTTLALSGCDHKFVNGYLPDGVTSDADRVTTLWNGAWIALFAVGFLVWGLMIWCIIAYRRKKDDNELPVQLRYNVPIEILYTVVPIFMIAVFFYYTAKDETALTENSVNSSKKADLVINAVGKQWSWDFNYVDDDAHEVGAQAIMDGKPGAEKTIPTLYMPVNETTEFVLTARDVIHSFWVPQFLKKQDMIPGRVNRIFVKPTQEGTFKGKCAELCGAYHSQMLFNVKVVSRAEYDAHIRELKAKGQSGLMPNGGISRQELMKGQEKLLVGKES